MGVGGVNGALGPVGYTGSIGGVNCGPVHYVTGPTGPVGAWGGCAHQYNQGPAYHADKVNEWLWRNTSQKELYIAKNRRIRAHTLALSIAPDDMHTYTDLQHLIEEHHLQTEPEPMSCPRVFCKTFSCSNLLIKVIFDPQIMQHKTNLTRFLGRLLPFAVDVNEIAFY
jgi:hypothetical protein